MSEMYKDFLSYRANFLHAQSTGKLAAGVGREREKNDYITTDHAGGT
jgi:hypothetical protein